MPGEQVFAGAGRLFRGNVPEIASSTCVCAKALAEECVVVLPRYSRRLLDHACRARRPIPITSSKGSLAPVQPSLYRQVSGHSVPGVPQPDDDDPVDQVGYVCSFRIATVSHDLRCGAFIGNIDGTPCVEIVGLKPGGRVGTG
jgi:hypothetical protein